MERYLSAAEVADRLAVSRSWVYKHKHALGGVQVGDRMWRFPESGIQAYLDLHATKPRPSRHRRPATRQSGRAWQLDY